LIARPLIREPKLRHVRPSNAAVSSGSTARWNAGTKQELAQPLRQLSPRFSRDLSADVVIEPFDALQCEQQHDSPTAPDAAAIEQSGEARALRQTGRKGLGRFRPEQALESTRLLTALSMLLPPRSRPAS
jgi:hypothetical protein